MSNQSIGLDANLHSYLLSVSLREHPVLQDLRNYTANHSQARMQISPEQGQFMALLVKMAQVTKALEVGVFTGYSALSVALALPSEGRLVACDVSDEYTAIARQFWERAGIAQKIDLHIAPAQDTLNHLIEAGEVNTFDFAFIDADKSNYDTYYEQALRLVRAGGLIAIDNVLWYGRVADPTVTDNRTERIRSLNKKLQADDRIDLSILPVGDGLALALKR
ncbi:class I SAM-dependent methyltransferase [Oscillatoria sp. CS-180]|uniref:class I SAM-dependent methyltransferase n=1 Tax=Oscillatoria sp. CS-180 TaxID=3021720 RepID=UPI00232D866C|nr:class I SAM-dependent methyltransferase [Oscillatoria sp. CS-180]MDB9524851.1 class I SAM-dependent methyltransferase [Oscillatoria sp. CS-180]